MRNEMTIFKAPVTLADRFFDDIFGASPVFESRTNSDCDVSEDDKQYMLSLDVPGMRKEDIKLEVHDNQLFISGERKNERRPLKFNRSYSLPQTVDVENISARCENGVLEVSIPKAPTARPRQITIQ